MLTIERRIKRIEDYIRQQERKNGMWTCCYQVFEEEQIEALKNLSPINKSGEAVEIDNTSIDSINNGDILFLSGIMRAWITDDDANKEQIYNNALKLASKQ